MRLAELITDMLGAEIQAHEIRIGSKIKTFHFRQFSDAEGRELSRLVEGESEEERGYRFMHELIALSVCDESGALISTAAEVAAMKEVVRERLCEKAMLTNNIAIAGSEAQSPSGDAEKKD